MNEDHESIAETEEWMGNVLREQKDFDRALEFYRHSLNSKRKIFGDSHEEVANAIYTLAITLDGAGHHEPAIMNFKEVRYQNLFIETQCTSLWLTLSSVSFHNRLCESAIRSTEGVTF